MKEKLYFYYTNDLHSNFAQWPRVASFLKDAKANRIARNESFWLMDVGDHADRVHPITEATMGKANVQLMNDLGYDAVTIGNNEGITLAHDDLFHLYDDADFHVSCANLHSMNHIKPNWLQPTVTMESINGIKIGVIGLTAPFNDFYELLDWHISSSFHALDKYVDQLKQSVDIIILLSHLGLNEDQEIARRYRDIDVIIGGHTHHLLRTGEHINDTLLTAAGKHCYFVGEVILTWDHQEKRLSNKEAFTTEVSHIAKDLQTEQTLISLQEEAENLLGETIAHLKKTIKVKWFRHTVIMQQLTNTVKAWTNADCAMLNAGLLLDDLPAGNVTYRDIHRICPHPINPCVVTLNGNELLEVVRATITKDFMELKLKGFGFRGEVLGRMVFSGIEVETAFHKNGEEYVKSVTYCQEPLDPLHTYRVATADTFTFGRLLPEIAKSVTKDFFLPEFLRDLLADTLKKADF
jgi:2',3'-cyclic-nucleotide 2'-phosphodiesterase (5'-nucleotidase family)